MYLYHNDRWSEIWPSGLKLEANHHPTPNNFHFWDWKRPGLWSIGHTVKFSQIARLISDNSLKMCTHVWCLRLNIFESISCRHHYSYTSDQALRLKKYCLGTKWYKIFGHLGANNNDYWLVFDRGTKFQNETKCYYHIKTLQVQQTFLTALCSAHTSAENQHLVERLVWEW